MGSLVEEDSGCREGENTPETAQISSRALPCRVHAGNIRDDTFDFVEAVDPLRYICPRLAGGSSFKPVGHHNLSF